MIKHSTLIRMLLVVAISVAALAAVQPSQAQSAPLKDCTLKLGAQGTGAFPAKCGEISVPENYDAPGGRKLTIRFMVLPKINKGNTLPPVYHLEGGPGFSAITQYGQVWHPAYRLINQNHDIVLIDQRGTGESAPLQCQNMVDRAFDDLKTILPADQEGIEQASRLAACSAKVRATADPAQYHSSVLARDTDAVRAALGHEKIALFGTSYGTWLAQFYIKAYADRLWGVILEASVGPWDNFLADTALDSGLNSVFALCAANERCNSLYPDLPTKLKATLEKLDAAPVQVNGVSSLTAKTYPVTINGDRLLIALRNMAAQGSLVGSIPQAVTQAASGTFTFPSSVLVSLAEQSPFFGQHYSILCAEQVIPLGAAAKGNPAEFGTLDNLANYQTACRAWRSAQLDPASLTAPSGPTPVLFLAGALDPITPVAYAEAGAKRFPNSTLAVFPYEGHGVMPFNRCAQDLAVAFLANPTQQLDTACTAQNTPPAFIGAYSVRLTRYEGATFTANVPEGWAQRATQDGMVFFEGTGATPELLGLGVYTNVAAAQLLPRAEAAVKARYGDLYEQATVNQLGVTIRQYTFSTPQGVYIGAVIAFGVGPIQRAVFYAGPPNVFTAAFSSVVVSIFSSLLPK
jgi:pimeloyl-ACP methyl ester carboxylesterase